MHATTKLFKKEQFMVLKTLANVSVLSLAAFGAVAQERTVNVYNWSDYIDEQVLKDFESQTGISVNYDTFDTNELLETKLLTGGSGYDVVVPTAYFLSNQIKAGVFMKLEKDKLPNLKNMSRYILRETEVYDPGNQYSINYTWGTTGLGLNENMVKQRLGDAQFDTWSLIFDPENLKKLKDCGVYMVDAPAEVFPAALKYLGKDPNSHDTEDLKAAAKLLETVRPYILKFSSSEYINALADGDICLAFGWSGDVLIARERAKEAGAGAKIQYAVPREGTEIWFEQMAIPADAPHKDEAHEFLNFIMDPKVMAQISDRIFYANGNAEAANYMKKEVLDDPAVYPPKSTIEKLYTTTAYPSDRQRLLNRLWTRIKTGQ